MPIAWAMKGMSGITCVLLCFFAFCAYRWGRMPVRPDRPKLIVSVCWERLAEFPVQASFNFHCRQSFNDVLGGGRVQLNELCYIPPIRQLPGAVAIRWSVPVMVAIPEPIGGKWW